MRPWGSIKLDIYGGSHEKRMGLTMELPKGLRLDGEIISRDIERRRGGSKKGVTSRTEADVPICISGVRGGVTTGDTLRVEFENSDARPEDYEKISAMPRPSHCDYPAYIKYGSIPPGGGMFSGRMTLPLVFAGAVARQLLMQRGMTAGGHYYDIGGAWDAPFHPLQVDRHTLDRLRKSDFPVLDVSARRAMEDRIGEAAERGDSVGGSVELCALGLPVGTGGPLWEGLESSIASIMYAVPGVKGVEFGAGFRMADMHGSDANDGIRIKDGKIAFESNNSGGINGGITNGMPILFQCAVKPTPSIAREQQTVNFIKNKNTPINIKGRHDPAIIRRICPVIDSVTAIVLCDLLAQRFGTDSLVKGVPSCFTD